MFKRAIIVPVRQYTMGAGPFDSWEPKSWPFWDQNATAGLRALRGHDRLGSGAGSAWPGLGRNGMACFGGLGRRPGKGKI